MPEGKSRCDERHDPQDGHEEPWSAKSAPPIENNTIVNIKPKMVTSVLPMTAHQSTTRLTSSRMPAEDYPDRQVWACAHTSTTVDVPGYAPVGPVGR